ncbi:uncharacterized protein LOC127811125 [Diospyros lotus]|uniref:uncharacterized protein LOC127811125 n=1 Tax=Diospyros lotus TaxID=55363 RepID=UPI0022517894|nr:uncharacterized protein LOC127811125 [Diospyros lotus]
MKAYVDDMIVKSRKDESHVKKLAQVLGVFRQHKMRLNPAKCAFRVQSRKFLGYMITQREIEANPEKIQAILDMESLTSTKEVQRLIGRIAALGRFLSKSAERELPFLRTLRARKSFEWTEQCQKSFEALKEYLKEVPLLTQPEIGETLYLYLGISDGAISAILIKKEGQVDRPMYYVSKVLHGPERCYPFAEKMALALLNASRKLRLYFQAHSIIVLTDQPLWSILQKPEYSGRLTKWSIELSEYDIQYQPRQAIKGQALADFIVECAHSSKMGENEQFDCDSFRKFCDNLGIELRFASVVYPQANGQAEVSNRTILHGLKTRLEWARGTWADKLPSILWAYRTTSRVATGETPFNLVYGTEALIPIELLAKSPRLMAYEEENGARNFEALRENLDLIEEQRDNAAMKVAAYQRRITSYFNSRVKNRPMKERDLVLRRSVVTNALKDDGKLRANWEGPYRILKLIGPNTCILQTLSRDTLGKTWNLNYLKLYMNTIPDKVFAII